MSVERFEQVVWHCPGLGEIHSDDHKFMIYCEVENANGEMIVSDSLADFIIKSLKNSQLSHTAEYEQLKPTIAELVEKAQAVINRWESPDWKDGTHTGDYIYALRDVVNKVKGD